MKTWIDKRGFSCIGLDNPKDYKNVAGVMRAASVYSVAMVASSGDRYKSTSIDTTQGHKHIPLLPRVNNLKDIIPYDCTPVAVDLIDGATPLPYYEHPKRAFYIFGAEDATLGARVTDWCKDVVYIPASYCMNLAATVNVVLYDRLAKTGGLQ